MKIYNIFASKGALMKPVSAPARVENNLLSHQVCVQISVITFQEIGNKIQAYVKGEKVQNSGTVKYLFEIERKRIEYVNGYLGRQLEIEECDKNLIPALKMNKVSEHYGNAAKYLSELNRYNANKATSSSFRIIG